jgi:hypothetical protein
LYLAQGEAKAFQLTFHALHRNAATTRESKNLLSIGQKKKPPQQQHCGSVSFVVSAL